MLFMPTAAAANYTTAGLSARMGGGREAKRINFTKGTMIYFQEEVFPSKQKFSTKRPFSLLVHPRVGGSRIDLDKCNAKTPQTHYWASTEAPTPTHQRRHQKRQNKTNNNTRRETNTQTRSVRWKRWFLRVEFPNKTRKTGRRTRPGPILLAKRSIELQNNGICRRESS